jgi:hypothetical protein
MLLKRYCRIGSRSFPDSFPPQSFRRRAFPRREGFVTTLLINADKCRRMAQPRSSCSRICGTRNNRIEFPSATLRKLKFRGCRRFLAATGQSFEVLVRDLSDYATTQELDRVRKEDYLPLMFTGEVLYSAACPRRSKANQPTLIARASEARSSTGIMGRPPLVLTGRLRM